MVAPDISASLSPASIADEQWAKIFQDRAANRVAGPERALDTLLPSALCPDMASRRATVTLRTIAGTQIAMSFESC